MIFATFWVFFAFLETKNTLSTGKGGWAFFFRVKQSARWELFFKINFILYTLSNFVQLSRKFLLST